MEFDHSRCFLDHCNDRVRILSLIGEYMQKQIFKEEDLIGKTIAKTAYGNKCYCIFFKDETFDLFDGGFHLRDASEEQIEACKCILYILDHHIV
jgi:hypothetical protein